MIALITGGSGSGKSEYAENQLVACGEGRRLYIATMHPFDEESRKRVKRHRAMRAGKGFTTVECYTHLRDLAIPKDSFVLLECMSNLVANEVFEADGAGTDTVTAVMQGVETLERQARRLFIVTNEIFSDGIDYDPETMRYLAYLGEINRRIAALAQRVTEVVYGIPLERKAL